MQSVFKFSKDILSTLICLHVTRMYRVCCKKDVMRLIVQMCSGKKAVIWNDFHAKQETSSNFCLSLNEILLECVLEFRLKNIRCLLGL